MEVTCRPYQRFLSPLRGSVVCGFPPTACAVGCILPPLRGWLMGMHGPIAAVTSMRFRLQILKKVEITIR